MVSPNWLARRVFAILQCLTGRVALLGRIALIAALTAAPAFAQTKGGIDWNRRVLVGHGQGAPDLNAPSVAVARLGAERAARLDAYRHALELLKGLEGQSGGGGAPPPPNDATLATPREGSPQGGKAAKTHQ